MYSRHYNWEEISSSSSSLVATSMVQLLQPMSALNIHVIHSPLTHPASCYLQPGIATILFIIFTAGPLVLHLAPE